MTDLPDKDELLLEAADLRMQSDAIVARVTEAKAPILTMLAEWKTWADEQNQEANRLRTEALNLEQRAEELYPDPNAQHANIAWQ